jgi:hypothetical protein
MKKFAKILHNVSEMTSKDNREYVTMIWLFVIYAIVNVIAITLETIQIDIIDNDIALLSATIALLGYMMYITKLWTIASINVEREETKAIEG